MSTDYSIYDNAFGSVLQYEGDIKKFLDAYFSFLYRRTDFYVTMKTPNEKMGFPPGIAEKLTMSAFRKYAALAAKTSLLPDKSKMEQEVRKQDVTNDVPIVGHVEEIVTSTQSHTSDNTAATSSEDAVLPVSNGSSLQPDDNDADRLKPIESSNVIQTVNDTSECCETAGSNADLHQTSSVPVVGNENNPTLILQQKQFQENPDSYNGAVRDKYMWSQSITDVDIRVKVPANIRRSGDVVVEVSKKRLKVAYRGSQSSFIDVVNGDLTWDIRKDESMWSLVPGEHVLVNLEKVQERWWEAVFTDEPKISIKKIDPSRPMSDLDDEAQTKIEELMFNENQKRLGLPQSHEKKMHDMLRQAWDAEGSPFKGQPFDPSKVNITPGSSC